MTADDHGSDSTYTNHACRCAACVEAHRVAFGAGRMRRASRLALDPTLAPHGTFSTYTNWCCRCDECTAAHASFQRQKRQQQHMEATS